MEIGTIMDDNDQDHEDYEFPPYKHPWREITTFVCFVIAIIWLVWEGVSWLIQAL